LIGSYNTVITIILEKVGKEKKQMTMSDVRIFNNTNLGMQVRTILNPDGSILVNAEDTARGFGFTKTDKKISENGFRKDCVRIDWPRVNGYCNELGFSQRVAKDDYIPESMFYLLGMKANNEAARDFQKWLAVDVISALRKTGVYEIGTVKIRNDIGQIASMMREWRNWATKEQMPYNMAMAAMVRFFNEIGVPFPEEMVYIPPKGWPATQLAMNFKETE